MSLRRSCSRFNPANNADHVSVAVRAYAALIPLPQTRHGRVSRTRESVVPRCRCRTMAKLRQVQLVQRWQRCSTAMMLQGRAVSAREQRLRGY